VINDKSLILIGFALIYQNGANLSKRQDFCFGIAQAINHSEENVE